MRRDESRQVYSGTREGGRKKAKERLEGVGVRGACWRGAERIRGWRHEGLVGGGGAGGGGAGAGEASDRARQSDVREGGRHAGGSSGRMKEW